MRRKRRPERVIRGEGLGVRRIDTQTRKVQQDTQVQGKCKVMQGKLKAQDNSTHSSRYHTRTGTRT